jgi:hypothetical protein
MTTYGTILFLHVASAVTLFSVLAIEWASLRGVRRARTYEEARAWSGLWKLLPALGLPATLVVLGSGVYLATVGGMWRLSWVAVALPTYTGIIVAGGVIGPRRSRAEAALSSGANALSSELRSQLSDPLLVASWRWRAALLVGILFVMTIKPNWSIWAIGAFALFGGLWSVPAWLRVREVA